MKKAVFTLALAALVAAPLSAQTAVVAGKPIFASDGKRIGVVYKVTGNGSAQVIVNGKLVTIPAATITADEGKYQTSLTKKEATTAG
jgi:ABC-type sugar transport system substrate-binding protein